MEEIRKSFKDKNFNKETLELIENFIIEFDDLFGKYVPKEELIKRIKENLNENINFTTLENERILGRYNLQDKKISISKKISGERLKSVFFHEMIHCITNHGDYVGFAGELELETRTAIGITEGFTQFVSKIRDKKYGTNSNFYPILTEQTENLAELLGVDKFLDVAFNNPEKLFDLMVEEEVVNDYIEAEDFYENFDIIWKNEDKIYQGKENSATAKGRLLEAIFGRKSKGNKVDQAKAEIISTFLRKLRVKPINSKEGFKELYEKSQKYSKQLDLYGDHKSLEVFFEKIEELEKSGKTIEEILDLVPEETQTKVELEFKIKDLLKLDPIEILKKIEDPKCDIYDQIADSEFEEYYNARIAQGIFRGIIDEEVFNKIAIELRYGLGAYILKNELNLDTLALEMVEFSENSGVTINLFEATKEKIEYIGTLSSAGENGEVVEFKVCSQEEREKLLEENEELLPEGAILVSQSGAIIEYNGNGDYIFVDECKNMYKSNKKISYQKSYAEAIGDRIKTSAMRYDQLQKFNVPFVLDKEKEVMKKLQKEYSKITREKMKFIPKDIENATKDITLEEIQNMLEETTEPQITRKESFEKGIGFDEH